MVFKFLIAVIVSLNFVDINNDGKNSKSNGGNMKTLLITCLIFFVATAKASANPKRILMMVSEGFYAPEYYVPFQNFKNQGYEVKTATKYNRATKPDERQRETHSPVVPDLTFDQIEFRDFDAIVFAGGNGAWEDFFPNTDVHKALTDFYKNNKVVALLCSSTGLLGVANNLDGKSEPIAAGKNVTGYKRVEGVLVSLGKVNYQKGEEGKPFVVVDGNLITGRDPISSELFSETIIKKLSE